jgi:hypothetical protein
MGVSTYGARVEIKGVILLLFSVKGVRRFTTETFGAENEKAGILADAVKFLRVLCRVHKGNPQEVDVDWSRIGYPLPGFLAWGEKWRICHMSISLWTRRI